jgi:hypothetical protein
MTKPYFLTKDEVAKIIPAAIRLSAVIANVILHSCSTDKISKPNHCAARGGGFVNAAKYYKNIYKE